MNRVIYIIFTLHIFLFTKISYCDFYNHYHCPQCKGAYAPTPIFLHGRCFGNFPQPMFTPFIYPNRYPWWARNGALNYQYFNYPGAWRNGGIDDRRYPGRGEVHLLKPNIYIKGKVGTKFHLDFNLKGNSNLIASSPYFGGEGVDGEIGESGIKIGGINYRYIFYDYRTGKETIQFEKGFCVHYEELLPELISLLKENFFHPDEIDDFNEHWKIKLPKEKFYCVYPQGTKQINKSVELNFGSQKAQIVRLIFIVLPHKVQPVGSQKRWKSPSVLASKKDEIIVREWGVGFLSGSD